MSPACSPVCPGIRRAVLCILLLSGLCLCLNHYRLIDEPKTWHEANNYCKQKYTNLAGIDNMEDVKRLIAAGGSGYEGKVWIGLYDRPNSWVWSLSGPDLYGEAKYANFKKWDKGQPDNIRRRGPLCVVFWRGFWHDYFCDKKAFVCYNKTNTSDSETTSIKRHFFINEQKQWYDARRYCQDHYTDLTSVRNELENTMIQEVVPDGQMAAIGLHRNTWTWWSDGTGTTFENWADGHPRRLTEKCAASVLNATHPGKWVGDHCSKKLHFMCQNNKKHLFNVKMTALKSTIDLNDPAVTETILNLTEKEMNEKGMRSDFKISWIKKPDKNIFHKEEKNTV